MPANANSYTIRGCAVKLCRKNRCHLFYFMFVEIRYVSTCAVAIGGESVANRAISHCKKMAKVRVSFGVACSFIPEDKNQAWFMSSDDTHPLETSFMSPISKWNVTRSMCLARWCWCRHLRVKKTFFTCTGIQKGKWTLHYMPWLYYQYVPVLYRAWIYMTTPSSHMIHVFQA